jgi:hypothetical protein
MSVAMNPLQGNHFLQGIHCPLAWHLFALSCIMLHSLEYMDLPAEK